MLTKICLFFIFSFCYSANGETDHGFLPFCNGAEKPIIITDSWLNSNVWFVVQAHFPNYTYRKRFYFKDAIHRIGSDPDLDFENKRTMVFMDGYIDTPNQFPVRIIQGSYASKGYITIAMDCQTLNSFIYPLAARTNRQIGNLTATLVHGLMRYGLKAKNLDIVGLSMGGQTVSFVAKRFFELSGKKPSSIVGLDPSGPCFRNLPPSMRLTPSDAEFVQVIHTGNDGFGMGTAQGHVDFYINGAEYQYLQYTNQPWVEELLTHLTVSMYYLTSFVLHPDKFVGVKCKNTQQARQHRCYDNTPHVTNVMGPKVDRKKRGIFYIPVQAEAPFYAPKDFLKTRPNYPLQYHDALYDVDNYILNECFHCKHESPI